MPFTVPIEMYKEDHFRVVHSEEEMEKLTKGGWTDVEPSDRSKLSPWSNAPSQVELTRKRAAAARHLAQVQAPEAPFDPGPRPAVLPPPVHMVGSTPPPSAPAPPHTVDTRQTTGTPVIPQVPPPVYPVAPHAVDPRQTASVPAPPPVPQVDSHAKDVMPEKRGPGRPPNATKE